MHKKISGFSVTGFLMTTLALSSPGAALAGDDPTFIVDGLSGKIYQRPKGTAHPGDTVTVRVVCADMINYEYTIEQTEKVELVERIQVVGAGGIETRLQGVVPGAEAPELAGAGDVDPSKISNQDLFDEFFGTAKSPGIRPDFAAVQARVAKEISEVTNLSATLPSEWPKADDREVAWCPKWPPKLETVTKSFDAEDLKKQLGAQTGKISRFLDKLQQIKLWLAGQPASGGGGPAAPAREFSDPPPTDTFITQIEAEANKLANEVTTLQASLAEAQTVVAYWEQVMTMHGSPVLEQRFRMDQVSSRYVVQVKRRAVSGAAQEIENPDEKGKYPFATLASLPFESHALARFNFTLGMVGVDRPDDRAFSIAPRVGEDDAVSHRVIESETSDLDLDAGLYLGIYLGERVDPFDRDSGAWMAMLGTEFDSSPDTFYLGLGYDTPTGMVFGFGATLYRRTSLAEGWEVGQEVPLEDDGTPRVETVPTVEDDDVGFYALVGFRPGLFKLWWSARKN